VELAEVDVVVHAIELVRYEYPDLEFRTTVSAGTYVRSIGRDLGERLGIGAHLTALRREAIGDLRVEQAVALEAVGPDWLKPPLEVLRHLPRLNVSDDDASALGFGRSVPWTVRPSDRPTVGPILAVAPDERLVAVGSVHDQLFRPEVVLEAAG
jgi:tRNA pseudouridine55 synthase